MTLDFSGSSSFSVGMEMEYQLLEHDSLDLTDGILPLMERVTEKQNIKPEFIQDTVEVASSPCEDAPALDRDVRGLCAKLLDQVKPLSIALAGSGTHPFSQALATITPLPRYQLMQASYGYTARTQITFATHVHIGVDDGDEAIRLMRELKTLLPVLIALSANSPFWRGYETGFASYRRVILASSRTYGQPPDFSCWRSFSRYVEQCQAAGVFQNINDIHWDIRPRPKFGTVEVRVMDAQSTVSEACALAVLIRAMVRYVRAIRVKPESRQFHALPWWVHKDNCYLAARDALEAKMITGPDGRWAWLRDCLEQLLDVLHQHMPEKERPLFAPLSRNLGENLLGYQRQRNIIKHGGTLSDIVEEQCSRLIKDIQTTK